jgi:nicotinamide mononucleotide transporter
MEIIAVVLTLLCVFLLNKQNILGWPVGIIAAGLYSYIFIETELYGQVFLQGIFILQSIYGWWYWKRGDSDVNVTRLGESKVFYKGIFLTLIFVLIFLVQPDWGLENRIHGLDFYCLFLALWANYLLSKKVLESWLIWIVCDIFMIILMCSQELWWSAGLYVLLLMNASNAYLTWKNNYDTQRL